VSKLALVDAVDRIDGSLAALLGARLHIDDGTDDDDWSPFVLGAPGLRLAGGTDEIHLNVVAQRGLGLPR
jgi:alkylation response protein AidB-like acyl-CoA dehydrogenase